MAGLKEELERSGLDERQQLLMTLFPGILFGFPPPNLKEMLERIDCSTCRQIAERVVQTVVLEMQLQSRVNEFCKPVREANARRQAIFKSRRCWPIIGHVFREPLAHPDPDYTQEIWYLEQRAAIDPKMAELEGLRNKDIPHWGTPQDMEISRTFVGCFLAKDGYEVTTR